MGKWRKREHVSAWNLARDNRYVTTYKEICKKVRLVAKIKVKGNKRVSKKLFTAVEIPYRNLQDFIV